MFKSGFEFCRGGSLGGSAGCWRGAAVGGVGVERGGGKGARAAGDGAIWRGGGLGCEGSEAGEDVSTLRTGGLGRLAVERPVVSTR